MQFKDGFDWVISFLEMYQSKSNLLQEINAFEIHYYIIANTISHLDALLRLSLESCKLSRE